ncbi:MAG: FliI/YscN family ATPase [Deltaproteobacteria bacterium]|nr:FliI/YscN family ATPase [Deltaproteobacteria bacterium]
MNFERLFSAIKNVNPLKFTGRVSQVKGIRIESEGPFVEIGTMVTIHTESYKAFAQVVGFENGKYILFPFEENLRISLGSIVEAKAQSSKVAVSEKALGRILNCFNEPIDQSKPIEAEDFIDLYRLPPNPIARKPITETFETKIKSIDILLTAGKGQRLGIFAGAGLGKSTLLGMIARHSSADINVICLVGERGREVKEFLERDLKNGLDKSVVIVSTAEESSLRKIRAALLALAYAEYFRDKGRNVLFLCDSLTRLAQSLRDLKTNLGEIPVARGYPPSCFQFLAKYLERFGNSSGPGTLTSFFTVLVEGDDLDEPVSDTVKAILDGHIVLSKELAIKGVYPAIDILRSISRLADTLQEDLTKKISLAIRTLVQTYEENKDLFLVGAYKPGTDITLDTAINKYDEILNFLKQLPDEFFTASEALEEAKKIFRQK